LRDDFALGPIWPVYPELAERFRARGPKDFVTSCGESLSLDAFIERSYRGFAGHEESLIGDERVVEVARLLT
jgi:hypothetical protein